MKISQTFKEAISNAAEKLGPEKKVSLSYPFHDNYVTLEKPQQTENTLEIKFRERGIDRDGSFFLVIEVM